MHYTLFNSLIKSAVNAADSARATELFGCMTMSHPAGISIRWQRTISRRRRLIRLRTTAPPRAFLMLKPNRLCGTSLARKKTVKWELERRFPARYTASNSPRRTSRASRGNPSRPGLIGREAMASLLAARRQDSAAAFGLHARTEPVRLRAAASPRLKCALRQSNPPLSARPQIRPFLARPRILRQAASAAHFEFISVFDPRAQGQEMRSSADRPVFGKRILLRSAAAPLSS